MSLIAGSLASSIYGEIRATYDVDLSVQIALENMSPFVEELTKKQWSFTPERIIYAVQTGTDFQLIDQNGGLKADCYAVHAQPTPRQQRTLERAKQLPYGYQNKIASFMSPEDVILYKGEAIDYA
jgi:hypothetical protein